MPPRGLRRGLGLAVLAACTLAFPRRAPAFSKPNHKLITAEALRIIQTCVDAAQGRRDELRAVAPHATTLTDCNVKQDRIYRKTVLWHFYGAGEPLGGSWTQGDFLSVDNGLDRYFVLLSEAFAAAGGHPDETYAHAAALLHLIQDVAVPAHAVPIFHPSLRWQGDNFDGFAFQAANLAVDEPLCQRLLDGAGDTWASLLKETADATLLAIEEKLPAGAATVTSQGTREAPLTWKAFWDRTPDENRFGRYGCVGDKFSKLELSCDDTKLTFRQDAYEAFALRLQRLAVEATVRGILLAHRAAPRRAEPGPAVNCPVAGSEGGKLVVSSESLEGCNCAASGGAAPTGGALALLALTLVTGARVRSRRR